LEQLSGKRYIGIREVAGIFQDFVSEPKNVEAGFVTSSSEV
jgi:hypothetical protein